MDRLVILLIPRLVRYGDLNFRTTSVAIACYASVASSIESCPCLQDIVRVCRNRPIICGGGSPPVSSYLTDAYGTITAGTSATGCTLAFTTALGKALICSVTNSSSAIAAGVSTNAMALTIINASADGFTINEGRTDAATSDPS